MSFYDYDVLLDGGTMTFSGVWPSGESSRFELTQHAVLDYSERYLTAVKRVPGRIYVDGRLIDIRSTEEGDIIGRLRELLDDKDLHHGYKTRLVDHIDYIESDQFVMNAETAKEKANSKK